MNCVNLIGRLVAKPEMKQTANGIDYVYVTIAVKRETKQEPDTDFIPIKAYRQSAKFLADYGDKGKRVSVTGKLRINESRTQNGESRKYTEVVADNVNLLDRDAGSGQSAGMAAPDPFDDIFS